uniref:Uncharacterized protein n=1 Tax=Cucumis sativus TaxID=3659 RepID=A0A0A0KH35_CUCSA
MTLTENEENANSSNTKTPDIKNKNIQQQEQDINLQICASTSQEQNIEIVLTNEELVRSPKRSRITESDEAESSKNNEQESYFFLGCEDLGEDPLLEAEEILLKYNDFIEYVYQILKNDEKKQDWSEIVKRVQNLANLLHLKLAVLIFDIECLEQHPRFEKQYNFRLSHIPNIITVIEQINIEIISSKCFSLVLDNKNRRKVLPICLREFERWRQQLSLLIEKVQRLKKMALEIDRDHLETQETD